MKEPCLSLIQTGGQTPPFGVLSDPKSDSPEDKVVAQSLNQSLQPVQRIPTLVDDKLLEYHGILYAIFPTNIKKLFTFFFSLFYKTFHFFFHFFTKLSTFYRTFLKNNQNFVKNNHVYIYRYR